MQYLEMDKNIFHVNIILYFSILKDYILLNISQWWENSLSFRWFLSIHMLTKDSKVII